MELRNRRRERGFFLTNENNALGYLSKECGHTCPLGQFAQAAYDGSSNPGGPAIRITQESGVFGFRGLVALYVPAQEVIALVVYDGENLSGIGTVITAVAATLVAGDVLRIEADTTNPELYRVKVNGTAVITRTVTDETINIANSCVGFVRVASVTDTIELPSAEEGDPDVLKMKSADESVSGSTTLQDDDDLFFAAGAGEEWAVMFVLQLAAANSTPDFKWQISAPVDAVGHASDMNFNYETLNFNAPSSTVSINVGNSQLIIAVGIKFVSAGNCKLQWSQAISNAGNTTVLQGSYMTAFKKQ